MYQTKFHYALYKYSAKTGPPRYHEMHVMQFQNLGKITGDEFFFEESRRYLSNWSQK